MSTRTWCFGRHLSLMAFMTLAGDGARRCAPPYSAGGQTPSKYPEAELCTGEEGVRSMRRDGCIVGRVRGRSCRRTAEGEEGTTTSLVAAAVKRGGGETAAVVVAAKRKVRPETMGICRSTERLAHQRQLPLQWQRKCQCGAPAAPEWTGVANDSD